MSFRAMSWAASVKTQTPTQKLILLLLADRANDDGFCFPSLQTIADDACMSRQCVIENIKKLAGHRLITVTRRTIADAETGQTRNTSNIYKLNTGVVNEVDHPSQRGLLGVVNEVDPNLSIEPINESGAVKKSESGSLKRFQKPTIAELSSYISERVAAGKPAIDPERFLSHYESVGWLIGKSPMKDWRAAVRTWEKNQKQTSPALQQFKGFN